MPKPDFSFAGCLDGKKTLNNRYFCMRHGQAANNVEHILASSDEPRQFPLTKAGKEQVEASVSSWCRSIELSAPSKLMIISSTLARARESAETAKEVLKRHFGAEIKIEFSEALKERGFGELNGRLEDLWLKLRESDFIDPTKSPHSAESPLEVHNRLNNFLAGLENQYKGVTFLLVSHADPIQVLQSLFKASRHDHYSSLNFLKTAEITEITLECRDK